MITSTAFPPVDFPLGAIVGPALFFRGPRGFSSGFLYGVGLLAPHVYWLFAFTWIAPFVVICLSGLFYGIIPRVAGGSPVRFAAAMTAVEFVRSVGTFAFPWAVAGGSSAGMILNRWAPHIGIWGISFSIYLLSGLGARSRWHSALVLTLLLGVPWILPAPQFSTERMISIGVVQGNFYPERDYAYAPEQVLSFHRRETEKLASRGAELVIWSETVILEYLNEGRQTARFLRKLAEANNVTLIVGAPSRLSAEYKRNSAFVFDGRAPGTPVTRYDKHHLVPFGEYIPGYGPDRSHAMLPEGTGDFSPSLVPRAAGEFAIAICYEGAFPDVARTLLRQDARLLVNISNDAFSYSKIEAMQHSELVRASASEFSVSVVRAGNVGPSFAAGPDGRVVAGLGAYQEGSFLARVPLTKPPLFAANYLGDWGGWLCLLGLALSLTIRGVLTEDIPLYE